MNWYAMGVNVPSFIDEARDRAAAVRAGDDYEARVVRSARGLAGTSRDGSIRAWRGDAVQPQFKAR